MIQYLWRHPAHVVHYLAYRLFLSVVQALPLDLAVACGASGGRHMVRWTRRNFKRAVKNMRHAFPALGPNGAHRLAVRCYEHFGQAFVVMAVAHRLLRPGNFLRHVVIRDEHFVEQVKAAGKGAIFVTAHLGVWEMFGPLMRHWGIPWSVVYRPAKNPLIDRDMLRWRKTFATMIAREGALPKLLRTLRGGGYIGLVADQHAKRDGVWVPFFGRLASTAPAPALLALRTGAPIVTLFVRRAPGAYRFEVLVDEPIRAEPTGDRDADVYRITTEISRRFEEHIRHTPEQWLWMHRRWRTPPAGAHARSAAQVSPPETIECPPLEQPAPCAVGHYPCFTAR